MSIQTKIWLYLFNSKVNSRALDRKPRIQQFLRKERLELVASVLAHKLA